jgi:hypothetical protein
MAFTPLPAYNVGGGIDFSPVERALDGWRQSTYQNALLGLRERAEGRADEEQGWQRQKFQQDSQDRKNKALGAAAQSLLSMPTEQRGKALQAWRVADKDFDADLHAAGFHPEDVDTWGPVVVAKARGVQDPLEQRKTESEINKTNAQADYYRSGGRSAAAGSSAEERQIDALMHANPDLSYPEAMELARTRPSDRTRRQSNAIGAAKAGLAPEDVEPWEQRFGVAPRAQQPRAAAPGPQQNPSSFSNGMPRYSPQAQSKIDEGRERVRRGETQDILREAREAIANGMPPEKVRERLQAIGINGAGF